MNDTSGFDEMKAAHDLNMAFIDWAAKDNPEGVKNWLNGQLESGMFLVIPAAFGGRLDELGFTEEARKNIHISQNLKAEPHN